MLAFLLAMMIAAQSSAAGSVRGTVRTADGSKLADCVVYLESAGRTFPPPEQAAVVSQRGATFSPPLLVISVGQAVEFHNDEDRPIEHNVFSRSTSKVFDLGLYPPPDVKTVTFDKPGVVRLFCSIHRLMDGTIYVCPTPFFAKTSPDGSYRIDNVPAGEWRLRTWQRKARFNEADVHINVTGSVVTQEVTLTRG